MVAHNKLCDIAYRVGELKRRIETRPHEYIRLLPPQLEVAESEARFRLFRAGNQSLGKSTLGLLECIWRATGEHPFRAVPTPPVDIYIICDSDNQSLSIQEKLWKLLPKDLIVDTEYQPGIGFRGRPHVVKFKNGSLITFKTVRAGSMGLAGATVDFILFDEPPEQRIYGEAVKRVQARNGDVLLTMTPVNRDCSFIKDLVAEGKIEDHHFRLKPEYLIPVGADKPLTTPSGIPMDDAWIASIEAESLELEIPVVVHGEWEFRADGNVFSKYDPEIYVRDANIPDNTKLYIGIDHGSGADFSSVATLVGVTKLSDGTHQVFIMDEYVSDGETTIKQDVAAVVSMLNKWSLKWRDLDAVYGDRLYMRANGAIKKSNRQLERELQTQMGLRRLYPPIKIPYKKHGSVMVGTRYLNDLIITERIVLLPGCKHASECFLKWDGTSASEWKHSIDAIRYALDDYIWQRVRKTKVSALHNG